jgi:putative hydrolase of the HAD superfamily
MAATQITTLFLDIGGVLLTNGWDRIARQRAATKFGLDHGEMDERHHLTFTTYEEGKLSLDEYLNRVVFYQPRQFSRDDFKTFMYAQSQPYQEMIDWVRTLKERHRLKVAVVSNEGRELTIYRVQKFALGTFVDFFVSSCFVHFRKPDADIFRIALDIAQVQPSEVVYIEDRPMFVQIAQGLGLHGIRHTNYESTRAALETVGLAVK